MGAGWTATAGPRPGQQACFWRFTFVGIDTALTYYTATIKTP